MVKIRCLFEGNCGSGARYISHSLSERDGYKCLMLRFQMVPEGRLFDLDHVIREFTDDGIAQGVLKLAAIARDIRGHIGAVDGHS